ncbi:MAG: methionyl-tRNA formyltransferase [Acidobacteriota bacterium]
MVIRVVFLGTPEFALPTLQALLDCPDVELAGVITQPDRPAGRGRRLTPPPVKEAAVNAGVPVWQFERIRRNPEALEVLEQLHPDVGVVVAFGQILPPDFFGKPPHGMLNVHASILPKYRGAAPIVHALLNGERETGVSIMKIDAGMDTGGVLKVLRVPIEVETTAGELEATLSRRGAELLVEVLPDYIEGRLVPVPQDPEGASHAPMIRHDDARVDWSRSAWEIHNRIRAMNPNPGAYCYWRGQELKLWRSFPGPEVADLPEHAQPGRIVIARDGQLGVLCGDGRLVTVTELQMPGRRRLSARDFINGMRLSAGELFT